MHAASRWVRPQHGPAGNSAAHVWVGRVDGVVLVLAGLVVATLILTASFTPIAAPVLLIAPSEGSPEWVALALATTVGTTPVDATAALFAQDALLAEWRPGGQYLEASDTAQRQEWLSEQAAAGRRFTADHLHVRGRNVVWRAWLMTGEDFALGQPSQTRISVVALDDGGRIRTWTLFPPDACEGPESTRWPCSALGGE